MDRDFGWGIVSADFLHDCDQGINETGLKISNLLFAEK